MEYPTRKRQPRHRMEDEHLPEVEQNSEEKQQMNSALAQAALTNVELARAMEKDASGQSPLDDPKGYTRRYIIQAFLDEHKPLFDAAEQDLKR